MIFHVSPHLLHFFIETKTEKSSLKNLYKQFTFSVGLITAVAFHHTQKRFIASYIFSL